MDRFHRFSGHAQQHILRLLRGLPYRLDDI